MSAAIVGLLGALAGATAVVGGAVVQARAAERAEVRRSNDAARRARDDADRRASEDLHELARRYLFQLQDAVESLRFRVDNWANRGGPAYAESVDPGYWEITTLYALGRALAAERILTLEGVYLDLARLDSAFEARQVEDAVGEAMRNKLFYYHRLALAESVLDRETAGFRLLTYTEFRHRYDDPARGLQSLLTPVEDALGALRAEQLNELENKLSSISQRVLTLSERTR